MKIRIMIQDYEVLKGETRLDASKRQGHSEVWRGEIELLKENVYITKISILADGEPQPICDIPFSINKGYYMWVPPATADDYAFGELALIARGQGIELENTAQIGPPQIYDETERQEDVEPDNS